MQLYLKMSDSFKLKYVRSYISYHARNIARIFFLGVRERCLKFATEGRRSYYLGHEEHTYSC